MAKVATAGQRGSITPPHRNAETHDVERTKPGEWEPKYAGGSFPSVPSRSLRFQVDYPKRKPTPNQILIIV